MSDLRTYTLAEIEERTGFDKRTIAYYVQQGLVPKVGRRGPKTRYPQVFLERLQFVKLVRDTQDRGEIGSLTLAEIRTILERLPEEMVGDVVAGREPLQAVAFPGSAPAPDEVTAPREVVFAEARRFEDRMQGPSAGSTPGNGSRPGAVEEPVDLNRKVRLGVLDVASQVQPPAAMGRTAPVASAAVQPAFDRAIQPEAAPPAAVVGPEPAPEARSEPGAGVEASPQDDPDKVVAERLGWALARLQRALTNVPKRTRGNTESWHRARITPELTISARNLPEEQAYLLDNLSRILKKLLWEAWEE
ncbi:MAG TPA: MerR family transcriptional regulator [Chondromyces sp.]|nr:MerR family transcriptional regulator [Chondromyces sp.]